MITFNFYTVEEKTPLHNQHIMGLWSSKSFGMDGFRPVQTICEYMWLYEDGTAYEYSEGDSLDDGRVLIITADGRVMDSDCVWCPLDEFFTATDKMYE